MGGIPFLGELALMKLCRTVLETQKINLSMSAKHTQHQPSSTAAGGLHKRNIYAALTFLIIFFIFTDFPYLKDL